MIVPAQITENIERVLALVREDLMCQTAGVDSNISHCIGQIMDAIIKQNVIAATFQSPLACYLACTAIDGQKGIVKTAQDCTPTWARMKYALRLFFFANELKNYVPRNWAESSHSELMAMVNAGLDDGGQERFLNGCKSYLSTGSQTTSVFAWVALCIGFGK